MEENEIKTDSPQEQTFSERAGVTIGNGLLKVGSALDRKIGGSVNFSWGLVILLLTVIFAIYNLVRVILYFFG